MDIVGVPTAQQCNKYNNWCKASKLTAQPSTIKKEHLMESAMKEWGEIFLYVHEQFSSFLFFSVWLQVILNEINQRLVELK